ncbi:MAG: alpha/beta fold hydrolase [Candidatus Melainabacteria bacterium]|nr:alpha/beta fold hydrolase [Candidatus Melainabacteria bacterium]
MKLFNCLRFKLVLITKVVLCVLALSNATCVWATVKRTDCGELAQALQVPVCQWWDDEVPLRGVVVAIHGMTLHGGTFDVVGRHLASQGFLVLAPDIRGFGRWYNGEWLKLPQIKVSYSTSRSDVVGLLTHLRTAYPGVPLFCLGESLGANQAMRVASERPDLVDGLILSGPGVWRRIYIQPVMAVHLIETFMKPKKKHNVTLYIGRRLSDDKRVIKAYRADPNIRKSLSVYELVQGRIAIKESLQLVSSVPATTPVLILQGTADKLFKASGVSWLAATLNCQDKTVEWLKKRGHLLLETPYVRPDVLQIIDTWLSTHLAKSPMYAQNVSALDQRDQ